MNPHDAATPGTSSATVLDSERLTAIFNDHQEDILNFLVGHHRAPIDLAEEALAATFAKLFEDALQGRPRFAETSALAYVKGAALNCLKNSLRASPLKEVPLHSSVEVGQDATQRRPVSIIQAKEKLDVVKAQWNALPLKERELLTHVDQEGLMLKEAAERMGLQYKDAASTYRRAHRALREELGRHWSTFILPIDEYKPRGRAAVLRHIDGLPREYRDVLRAKHVEGLSDPMAAAKLDLSIGTYRDRLRRGEEHLEHKTGMTLPEILMALKNTSGS